MNVAAGLKTTNESRSSIKNAGVTGARGKADGLDPRSNFNHGNFIHGAAARRLLASYKELDNRLRTPLSERDIEELRSQISHIVLVQANLIALGQSPWDNVLAGYRTLTSTIERMKLPVVALGMGAQVRAGATIEYRVHEDLLRLLQVVSAHSVSMAVRGAFTADALAKLGIDNATVIGCPSLFWRREPTLSHLLDGADAAQRPTAFNFTHAIVEHKLINQAIKADFDLIGQGMSAEEILVQRYTVEGDAVPYLGGTEGAFKQKVLDRDAYEAWVRKRFYQFSDADLWVQHMRRYRGAYGTRFHGNMSAYIAGVPALWITHDVRTSELCDHFRLPSTPMSAVKEGLDLATLHERMDYSECAKVYPERYKAMVDYLTRAGVNHSLTAEAPEPADEAGDGERKRAHKVIQLRNDTAYNRYPWIFKAAADHLLKQKDANPEDMRVLSFGCSKGDEVFALADRYFTQAKILGVDVAADKLQIARLANRTPERISFEYSNAETFELWKPFDAIFAMSVLCSWPGSKDKQEIADIFSFTQFEAVVEELDGVLRVGGLLVIYNANYRFRDTRFSTAYETLRAPPMTNSGFVSKFDRDCRRRPDFDSDNEIVFRKMAPTPAL